MARSIDELHTRPFYERRVRQNGSSLYEHHARIRFTLFTGNLVEADRCFGFAVEDAIARGVDVAIISGDSTDHSLESHSPAFFALAKRIKQLAEHCPVFMLQGTFSHEPTGMLRILEMIGAKHSIIVSDTIEMIGLRNSKWESYDRTVPAAYELVITCVPTLNKADLALEVGAKNANIAMGEHIAALMGSFAPENGRLRQHGVPTVLVSHGTVDGSMNESGVPMAGLDHEFTAGALFSAGTNAVMLGHIHAHQAWPRQFGQLHQIIAYPGSIGRFHYGEIGEKHYLNWQITATSVSFEPVITPSRRMIDLTFEGMPNLDEIEAVARQCEGAYIRVTYAVDEEFSGTIDRNAIKEILGGAAEVKIEGSVLTVQRQRCAGISSLPTLDAKFKAWCEISNTNPEGLLERLSTLQTNDPADIAHTIITRIKQGTSAAPVAAPIDILTQPLHPHLVDCLD